MDETLVGGTRERILKAAEVLFADRGFTGTRLHEIANSVGVQKASLFHHFASKEDLYREVLAYGLHETQLTIEGAFRTAGSPLDKVRSLIEAYIDLVVAHPARTKILLRQSLGDAPAEEGNDEAQRLLDIIGDSVSGWQEQLGNPPADVRTVMVAVVGMVAFFFTSAPVLAPGWFSNPLHPENVARIKRHVLQVVENSLAASLAARSAGPAEVAAT